MKERQKRGLQHVAWSVLCSFLLVGIYQCTGPVSHTEPNPNEPMTVEQPPPDSSAAEPIPESLPQDKTPLPDEHTQKEANQETTQEPFSPPDTQGQPEETTQEPFSPPDAQSEPDKPTTPDAPPTKGSVGCGKTSKAGFTCYNVTFEGAKRSWCMNIPANYDKQKPYSLVLGLHGCGGNNKSVHNHRAPMEKNGINDFLFAYPQAKSSCWSDKDIPFVKHVIGLAQKNHCLLPNRTFVHGMSSGGGMSTKVARAGLVKAFASVSGGGGATAMPAWYYAGKTDTYYKTIYQGVQYQHRVNGCKNTSKPIPNTPCVRYDGCKHAMVYCEDNRGHVWPKEAWCQGGILDFFRTVP